MIFFIGKIIMDVLIVDDSKMARHVLKKFVIYFFEMKNWEIPKITEAKDGLVAMQHIEKENVDILLLDCNMPIMDGKEVLNKVRENSQWNKIRIIMATTESTKEHVSSMIKSGVNGYIVKPFVSKSVYKTLNIITSRMPHLNK